MMNNNLFIINDLFQNQINLKKNNFIFNIIFRFIENDFKIIQCVEIAKAF